MYFPVIYLIFSLCTRIKAIKIIGRDVTVTAGDDAQLFCQVVDTIEPLTSITWKRRTNKNPRNSDFLVITSDGKEQHVNGLRDGVKFTGDASGPNGSIQLSNVTVLDEGIYTCVFSVFPSGPYETEVRLTVQVPPIIVGTETPAVAGDTEKIFATCTAANAKPAAEVSWNLGALNDSVKVKTVIVESEGRCTVKSNLIGNATKNLNQKKVQCLVKHPGLKETLELNYTLNIHYPPQLVYILALGHGETRKFQCETDANPKPTNFTWSREFPVKEPLSSGVYNTPLGNHLTPDNNGFYYCVASNQYGDAVGSLNVQVKAPKDCQSCWTLIIILVISGVLFFISWRFRLLQRCIEILRQQRHISVPNEPPVQEETSQ